MPDFEDFRRGEATAFVGRGYELVYTSGFDLPGILPDRETVASVLGGRPDVGVNKIDIDPIDGEIHAFVTVGRTDQFDRIFPVEMAVVPADEFGLFVSAGANLFGAEGFAMLDRWREITDPAPIEDAERSETQITSGLDQTNVRNFFASVSESIRGLGAGVGIVGIVVLVGLFTLIQD